MHDEPLLNAAGQIADGALVDWPSITSTVSSDEELELADELALVARIAEGHRQLHRVLPVDDHRPTLDRGRWGHLELLDVVGRGSYGTVYRAWETRLERLVALKVFHRAPNPAVVMREGQMLARVRHENVVTVYGADVIDGVAGIWMEFVHGRTLDQIVKEHGPMSALDAAGVGLSVSRALSAIHGAQLLHCDVKAQNVIREATGRVVLMDLGAGRPVPGEFNDDGSVTGTPRYMAPELFQYGTTATAATDVYAVGVLLYYLKSARFPVDGRSYQELRQAHLERRVTPLSDAPPAFLALVQRSMDQDPARRPQSPAALERALEPMVAPQKEKKPWTAMRIAGVAALAIGLAAFGIWRFSKPPATATDDRTPEGRLLPPRTLRLRSIAVLPIKNLTGDPTKAYLADGLTEVLMANLARVREFRVPSLAAVSGFSQGDVLSAKMANAAGVEWVLTGSLLQADKKFRMAVRLMDPKTNVAIWGDEIIREAEGMLSAQADIARFVAERLALTLGPNEQQALRARSTDRRAQDAYLRGLAIRQLPTARAEAARFFRTATEIDPSFASAWAELSLVEAGLNNNLPLPQRLERSAVIRGMAERAIELDPLLATGYAALGTVQFQDLWDFPAADNAFQKALAVDPSNGYVRQRYGMLLAALGRMPEAIDVAHEAVLIEPTVPARAIALGGVYHYARDYEKAEAEAQRALQLSPGFPTALFLRGQIAAAQGRYDDAITLVRQALAGSDHAGWLADLARMTAAAGRTAETTRLIAGGFDARQQRGDAVSPDNRAYLAAAQGRFDDAFAILEDAIGQRSSNVLWLAVDPRVDRLRADPRFAALLRKMRFTP